MKTTCFKGGLYYFLKSKVFDKAQRLSVQGECQEKVFRLTLAKHFIVYVVKLKALVVYYIFRETFYSQMPIHPGTRDKFALLPFHLPFEDPQVFRLFSCSEFSFFIIIQRLLLIFIKAYLTSGSLENDPTSSAHLLSRVIQAQSG